MNSSSNRKKRHPRLKAYVAALAACAAFAGGGQLLLATPASAMVSNGPGCGQSWFDQFGCGDEPGGGGGSGSGGGSGGSSGGAPAPAPAPSDPRCDDNKGIYCPTGTVPPEPKKDTTSKPPVKVVTGGSGRPPRDSENGGGPGRPGKGRGLGHKPTVPCQPGKKGGKGCTQIKCVVRVRGVDKVEFFDSMLECQQRRWEVGDETPEDRELRRRECDIIDDRIILQEQLIGAIDEQMETASPNELKDLIRRRALRKQWMDDASDEWLEMSCSQFSPSRGLD